MGQIVQFIRSKPYPETTDALQTGESVFLIAIRWWVAAFKDGKNPTDRLFHGLLTAGALDALVPLDALMDVVARSARRCISVNCPRCPDISDDEMHLLHAAGLSQAGKSILAERVLRTTLLSAQGAEFVVGPLLEIGTSFAGAGLFFCRHRAPASDVLPCGGPSREMGQ
jgi:hypothetical protein